MKTVYVIDTTRTRTGLIGNGLFQRVDTSINVIGSCHNDARIFRAPTGNWTSHHQTSIRLEKKGQFTLNLEPPKKCDVTVSTLCKLRQLFFIKKSKFPLERLHPFQENKQDFWVIYERKSIFRLHYTLTSHCDAWVDKKRGPYRTVLFLERKRQLTFDNWNVCAHIKLFRFKIDEFKVDLFSFRFMFNLNHLKKLFLLFKDFIHLKGEKTTLVCSISTDKSWSLLMGFKSSTGITSAGGKQDFRRFPFCPDTTFAAKSIFLSTTLISVMISIYRKCCICNISSGYYFCV